MAGKKPVGEASYESKGNFEIAKRQIKNIHTWGSRKKGKKNTIINPDGKMAEWSKALDSKSSKGQLFGGSNPPLSVFFVYFFLFSLAGGVICSYIYAKRKRSY